jgi:hypothetical protein
MRLRAIPLPIDPKPATPTIFCAMFGLYAAADAVLLVLA